MVSKCFTFSNTVIEILKKSFGCLVIPCKAEIQIIFFGISNWTGTIFMYCTIIFMFYFKFYDMWIVLLGLLLLLAFIDQNELKV